MITIEKEQKTYEDYAALEEGAPYQLIDGELIMSPAPTFLHQLIVWKLGNELFNFVRDNNLGIVVGSPVDVYFSETQTYQPDLVFVSNERREIITEKQIEGAPDLVVEVISPATGYYDLTKKRRVYEAAGVKEYWLVDPIEKTVTVLDNVEGTYHTMTEMRGEGQVASRRLDGFVVDLERLLAFK